MIGWQGWLTPAPTTIQKNFALFNNRSFFVLRILKLNLSALANVYDELNTVLFTAFGCEGHYIILQAILRTSYPCRKMHRILCEPWQKYVPSWKGVCPRKIISSYYTTLPSNRLGPTISMDLRSSLCHEDKWKKLPYRFFWPSPWFTFHLPDDRQFVPKNCWEIKLYLQL